MSADHALESFDGPHYLKTRAERQLWHDLQGAHLTTNFIPWLAVSRHVIQYCRDQVTYASEMIQAAKIRRDKFRESMNARPPVPPDNLVLERHFLAAERLHEKLLDKMKTKKFMARRAQTSPAVGDNRRLQSGQIFSAKLRDAAKACSLAVIRNESLTFDEIRSHLQQEEHANQLQERWLRCLSESTSYWSAKLEALGNSVAQPALFNRSLNRNDIAISNHSRPGHSASRGRSLRSARQNVEDLAEQAMTVFWAFKFGCSDFEAGLKLEVISSDTLRVTRDFTTTDAGLQYLSDSCYSLIVQITLASECFRRAVRLYRDHPSSGPQPAIAKYQSRMLEVEKKAQVVDEARVAYCTRKLVYRKTQEERREPVIACCKNASLLLSAARQILDDLSASLGNVQGSERAQAFLSKVHNVFFFQPR